MLNGVYSGLVEDNRDPEMLGRLKVRVPIAYGTASQIGVDNLPWALPRGLPSGGSNASGGMDFLPEPGDQVWVCFLDGEPEKPIWEWSGQSRKQAKVLKLHPVGPDGKPVRAAITRYGHVVELNKSSIILATNGKNVFVLDDDSDGAIISLNRDLSVSCHDSTWLVNDLTLNASGNIDFESERAVSVNSNDLAASVAEDAILNIGKSFTLFVGSEFGTSTINAHLGQITLTSAGGAVITADSTGNVAISTPGEQTLNMNVGGSIELKSKDGTAVSITDGNVSVSAENVMINGGNIALGKEATSTVVLTDLLTLLFNTHSHPSDVGPTGPPIVPITAQMIGSKTTLAQ